MPIPLADIPGAPNVGSPVLLPNLPGVPTARGVDVSGAALDDRGLQRAQSLLAGAGDSVRRSASRVAESTRGTKRELIDPRPFMAEGAALQSISEGIQHASGVINDFGQAMALAKDATDMGDLSVILSDARAEHQQWIEQNNPPPSEWNPKWNEMQPKVMEKIAGLGASTRIKGRVESESARFFADNANKIAVESTRRAIVLKRGTQINAIDRALADNNFELAHQIGEESVNVGIFSQQEWEAKQLDIEQKHRQNIVETAIAADPKSVAEDMAAARKSGKSEHFPWLNGAEILRAESQSKTLLRANRADSYEAGMDAIASGKWTTPEQVRKFGEANDWTQGMIESGVADLTRNFVDSPAGQAKIAENRAQNRAIVAAYDPETDPNFEQYYAVFDQIKRTMPPGYQEDLLDDLKAKRKEGKLKPSDAVKSAVTGEIRGMLSDGYFGQMATKKDGKALTNPEIESNLQASQKANQLMDAFTDWHRENPKATQADGIEWIRKQTAADRQTQKAGQKAEGSGFNWTDVIPFAPWHGYRLYKYFNPDKPAPTKEQIQGLKGKDMSSNDSTETARTIVNYEARRDKAGNLAVYKLPSGDGGGTYEVAGINDKYHPAEAAKLKAMVEAGKSKEAETEAARYIAGYGSAVAEKATNPGVKFALQDAAFNRGPTGAVRIMQKALGVEVDGKWGPKTQAAFDAAEKDPKALLTEFRTAREWYERSKYVGRSEKSPFWKGLVNRWDNQTRDALGMA